MEKLDALNTNRDVILKIENVDLSYDNNKDTKALDDFSMEIYNGEILGLVGESGCGKTTLGRAVIGLEEIDSGKIFFMGNDIKYKDKKAIKKLRQNVQMIFQDPFLSLDPTMTVSNVIKEPLLYLRKEMKGKERDLRLKEVMKHINMDEKLLNRKSGNLSGGQRQRVGIGRALAIEPKLIICDEPVSALDVSVQASILNLLRDLQKELNLTMIFISHDLSVVNYLADRICVMLKGKICEIGNKSDIFENSKHPYTRYLLESIPKINLDEEGFVEDVEEIEYFSTGCPFRSRCKYATEICKKDFPEKSEEDGHIWYCYNSDKID